MESSEKGGTSTSTPLFGKDLHLEGIPEEAKEVDQDVDEEFDELLVQVSEPDWEPTLEDEARADEAREADKAREEMLVPELSRGDQQLAGFRERLLKDLEKHANMHPKFKSKVHYYGRLQRLSVVMQNLAKQVRHGSLSFSLEQLEDLRQELQNKGYAAGPPIDLGIEAARRMVRGPEADDTPRRTDLDGQKLATGERIHRSDEGDPRD